MGGLVTWLKSFRLEAEDGRLWLVAPGSRSELWFARETGGDHSNLDLPTDVAPRAEKAFEVFAQALEGDLSPLFSEPFPLPLRKSGDPARSFLTGYNRTGSKEEALYGSDFLCMAALSFLRHSRTVRRIEDTPRPSKGKTGESLELSFRLWIDWAGSLGLRQLRTGTVVITPGLGESLPGHL